MTRRIGEFCEIFDGPHATPKKTQSGPYFLSISSLQNGTLDLSKSAHLSDEQFIQWTKRVTPQEGDLLFSYETRLGEAALMKANIKACLGRRMGILRPDRNIALPEYLLYSYLSPHFQATLQSNKIQGATVERISLTDLPNFPIKIPTLATQKAVVNILSLLDEKIELNNRINAELEGLAKLLYDYWFVQFDFPMTAEQAAAHGDPTLTGKPYKSSGGKMTHNKTLNRKIPEGWEAGTAKQILDFNPTTQLKQGAIAPHLDMNAVPTSGFMTKPPFLKKCSGGTKFQNGDVIVARITPCLENGKTAVVSLLPDNAIASGSTEFIILRGKDQPLTHFAACLARSAYFRKYAILNMAGTSGRKRVEAPILETISLPLPPGEILTKFEDTCRPFFEQMTTNQKQNQELAALRDWLLPMLMNGQVTVG